MCSPHTSYRWRGERDIETIKCMHSLHTSYRWRGERDIETIKCMHSLHTSYRWRGEREEAMTDKGQWGEFGQDTGVTPLLFTRSAMGFLMTTESQDLGLTSHPNDGPNKANFSREWSEFLTRMKRVLSKCSSVQLRVKTLRVILSFKKIDYLL